MDKLKLDILYRIAMVIDVSNELARSVSHSKAKGWKNTSIDTARLEGLISSLDSAAGDLSEFIHAVNKAYSLANKRAEVIEKVFDAFLQLKKEGLNPEEFSKRFNNFLNA